MINFILERDLPASRARPGRQELNGSGTFGGSTVPWKCDMARGVKVFRNWPPEPLDFTSASRCPGLEIRWSLS